MATENIIILEEFQNLITRLQTVRNNHLNSYPNVGKEIPEIENITKTTKDDPITTFTSPILDIKKALMILERLSYDPQPTSTTKTLIGFPDLHSDIKLPKNEDIMLNEILTNLEAKTVELENLPVYSGQYSSQYSSCYSNYSNYSQYMEYSGKYSNYSNYSQYANYSNYATQYNVKYSNYNKATTI